MLKSGGGEGTSGEGGRQGIGIQLPPPCPSKQRTWLASPSNCSTASGHLAITARTNCSKATQCRAAVRAASEHTA
jgi:hypothetical protein